MVALNIENKLFELGYLFRPEPKGGVVFGEVVNFSETYWMEARIIMDENPSINSFSDFKNYYHRNSENIGEEFTEHEFKCAYAHYKFMQIGKV